MSSVAESRIHLMDKEDDVVAEQSLTNQATTSGNHSMGPLRTYKGNNVPASAPGKSPMAETSSPCKGGSSDDSDSQSATADMDVPGHEPTTSSCSLRNGSMMSLYKVCRAVLKAALSAISLRENTGKEKEEEQEEEDNEEEEYEEDMEEDEEDTDEDEDYDDEEDMDEEEEEEEDTMEEEEEEYEEYEEYEENEEDEDQNSENNCVICAILRFINMFLSSGSTTA